MLNLFILFLVASGTLTQAAKNTAAYNALQSSGSLFPYGYYYIKNVATGAFIGYSRDSSGNNFFPSSNPYPIEFQPHNASTPWIRLRPDKTTKCASAQWGYNFCEGCNGKGCGCNWASVMYACQVDPSTPGSTLEPMKQFWIFNALGTSPQSYNIIPVDHLNDMATRGMKSCTRTTGTSTKSTCIEALDEDDNTFAWYVVDSQGNSITPSGGGSPAPVTTSSTAVTVKTTSSTQTQPAPVTTTSTTAADPDPTDDPTSSQAPILSVDPTRIDCPVTKTVTKAAKTVTKTKTKTVKVTVTKGPSKFVQANADFEWQPPQVDAVLPLDRQEKVVQLPNGVTVDFSADDSSLKGEAVPGSFLKWVARPGIWR